MIRASTHFRESHRSINGRAPLRAIAEVITDATDIGPRAQAPTFVSRLGASGWHAANREIVRRHVARAGRIPTADASSRLGEVTALSSRPMTYRRTRRSAAHPATTGSRPSARMSPASSTVRGTMESTSRYSAGE